MTNIPSVLKGPLPKIGIRPTIDGRRGVRESLEKQVKAMAHTAARFISSKLRYPDGRRVKVVIADECIGGAAEAAACAEKFAREGVGVSLTVTPCWCYGTETMDTDPLVPKAIWGFNGTERPGAVYLAAVLAGHNQLGLPAFGIYGREVQDKDDSSIPLDVQEKLLRFCRAGLSVALARQKSYLSIGNVSMGIAGSAVDHNFFSDYLDMRVVCVDMSELVRRLEEGIYDPFEFKRAYAWVKKYCREGTDPNPEPMRRSREAKNREWQTVIKMAMMVRDLMVGNPRLAELGFSEEALGHNAILAGFQGQRQWTDHFPNGDFLEAILNSSFDWNGIRAPYLVATENDSLNGVAMLFGWLLTGTAQIFADVRTYWSPEAVKRVTGHTLTGPASSGIIHLINSGAACLDGTGEQSKDNAPAIKPFWEITEEEVEKCLAATTWPPALYEYFRGGGFSSCYVSRGGMPLTMSRVSLVKGLGPVLQIAEGYSLELPEHVHRTLVERTNETWPTTWFVPRLTNSGPFRNTYELMRAWSANHAAVSYGHIGADLVTLASLLRIPVALHNVPEEKLFRPSAWGLFGTADQEGADFRACANFGPLYGKGSL